MTLVVLAGGYSPERDVSLASGSLIANALIANGHRVLLLDLYAGTSAGGEPDSFFASGDRRYHYDVPAAEPDLSALRDRVGGESLIGPRVLELCSHADLVFLALHGDIGENGKLQAVFEVHGIRYTGSDSVGSLLAMDKDISKQLMRQNGILTPDWICVNLLDRGPGPDAACIGFPCVVKPCGCGSSVGVSMVGDEGALSAALNYAAIYEDKVIIEAMIGGRELTVGVLDGVALPVIEIIPNEGFFDYANKYQPGLTQETCPADIPDALADEARALALWVHKVHRLGSYSRVDFMVDGDGNLYCIEVNSLPGMTPNSLLPRAAKAHGLSYNALCEEIVRLAL